MDTVPALQWGAVFQHPHHWGMLPSPPLAPVLPLPAAQRPGILSQSQRAAQGLEASEPPHKQGETQGAKGAGWGSASNSPTALLHALHLHLEWGAEIGRLWLGSSLWYPCALLLC